MSIRQYTNGQLILDGSPIDYSVCQTKDRTQVRRISTGKELHMPQTRYSLASDSPVSGAAGCSAFESDLKAAMRRFYETA